MSKSIHYQGGRDAALDAFGIQRPTQLSDRASLAVEGGIDRLGAIAAQKTEQEMVATYAQMGAEAGIKRGDDGNIAPLELYNPDTAAGRAFNANAISSYSNTVLLDAQRFASETSESIQNTRTANPDGTVGPRKAADMVDAWDKTWTPYFQKTMGSLPDAVRAQVQSKLELHGSQQRLGLVEKQGVEAISDTLQTNAILTNRDFRDAENYVRAGKDDLAEAAYNAAAERIRTSASVGGAKFDLPDALSKLELLRNNMTVEKEWRGFKDSYSSRVTGPNTWIEAALATKAEIQAKAYPPNVEERLLAKLNDKRNGDMQLDAERLSRFEAAASTTLFDATIRVTNALASQQDPTPIFAELRAKLDPRIVDNFQKTFAGSMGQPRVTDEQHLAITTARTTIQLGAAGMAPLVSEESIIQDYQAGRYGQVGTQQALATRDQLIGQASTAAIEAAKVAPEVQAALVVGRRLAAGESVNTTDLGAYFRAREKFPVQVITQTPGGSSRRTALSPANLSIVDPSYQAEILTQAQHGVLTEHATAELGLLTSPQFRPTPDQLRSAVAVADTVLARMDSNPDFRSGMSDSGKFSAGMPDDQRVRLRLAVAEYKAIFADPLYAENTPESRTRLNQALKTVKDRMDRPVSESSEVRDAIVRERLAGFTGPVGAPTQGGSSGGWFGRDTPGAPVSANMQVLETVRRIGASNYDVAGQSAGRTPMLYTNGSLQFAGLENPQIVGPSRILEGVFSAFGGYAQVVAGVMGIDTGGIDQFIMRPFAKEFSVPIDEAQKLTPQARHLVEVGGNEMDVTRFVKNQLVPDQFSERNRMDPSKVHLTTGNSVTRAVGDPAAANALVGLFVKDQAEKYGAGIAAGTENVGWSVNLPKSINQMIRDQEITVRPLPAGRGGDLPVSGGVSRFEVSYKTKNGQWVQFPDTFVVPNMTQNHFDQATMRSDQQVLAARTRQRELGNNQDVIGPPVWGVIGGVARATALAEIAIQNLAAAYEGSVSKPSYIGRLERKP